MNQNQSPAQSQMWMDFYEEAWAFRSQFVENLIASGERNPLRLISLLEAKQRKFKIGYDEQNRTALFVRSEPKENQGPSGVPSTRKTSYRGQFLDVPFYAETPLHKYIIDFIDEHGPFDAVIELGCGYGQNLFKMFYHGGPRVPYYGGEYTKSGVALAQKLASLQNDIPMQFFHFNHLMPDLKSVPKHKRVLVFTMHTIEQVNRIDTSLMKCIAGVADQVVCMHFEPFGFQMKELGPVSTDQKKYFAENRWNENLAFVLSQAHQDGIIKIEYTALEQFFPDDPYNATSLAIWKSSSSY